MASPLQCLANVSGKYSFLKVWHLNGNLVSLKGPRGERGADGFPGKAGSKVLWLNRTQKHAGRDWRHMQPYDTACCVFSICKSDILTFTSSSPQGDDGPPGPRGPPGERVSSQLFWFEIFCKIINTWFMSHVLFFLIFFTGRIWFPWTTRCWWSKRRQGCSGGCFHKMVPRCWFIVELFNIYKCAWGDVLLRSLLYYHAREIVSGRINSN